MRIAIYAHEADAVPSRLDEPWSEVVRMLTEHERTDCDPCPGHDCNAKFGLAWSPVDIGEHRGEEHVAAVTALVLDLDDLTREQVSAFATRLKPYECVIHSSHSHRGTDRADWRLRVVVALSEPVPAAQWREFRAKAVQALDTDGVCDPSCKDLSRLYFLPSCPAGATPLAIHNQGTTLDVEAILGTALAPVVRPAPAAPSRVDAPVVEQLGERERAAAVEALRSKLASLPGIGAAVAAGEDVLGPVGGQDNARHTACRMVAAHADNRLEPEDLLEVLRPSLEHADWQDGTEHLLDVCLADLHRAVAHWRQKRAAEAQERESARRATLSALAKVAPPAPPTAQLLENAPVEPELGRGMSDWYHLTSYKTLKGGGLSIDSTGRNAWVALTNDGMFKGCFRLNVLTQAIEARGGALFGSEWRATKDEDFTRIANALDTQFGIRLSSSQVHEQVYLVAADNAFEPVQGYLNGLRWDGAARLETWTRDFLGVAWVNAEGHDIESYVRAVSKKWLIAAVARALDPGAKVDTVLIVEGPQGVGKSSAFAVLGGEWFSDDADLVLGSKDSKMLLARVWIQEMPELAAIGRTEIEQIKAFITRQVDVYRSPFGKVVGERPRRCVFAGTTNPNSEGRYLRDPTGNRRFWPVRCVAPADLSGLKCARDQLWAEAVALYRAGEKWWLASDEERLAAAETEQRTEADESWETKILEWWAARGKPDQVTLAEVLKALGFAAEAQVKHADSQRAAKALARVGFEHRRVTIAGRRAWAYVPSASLVNLNLPAPEGGKVLKIVKAEPAGEEKVKP